eukprot:TRINITY_DN8158_c0_g1_i7.p1 TRINITY_DN8158_c0_g1~~TRINITY_DN8158_c0_g1_i7.p1  ORF type:complete len:257 (+),score=23.37 TRINITY_DN8158_c0_g1_i7:36-773(+)
MAKARGNVIPPLVSKPDSTLPDEMATLRLAARHWKVGDVRLDERLWTRSGPFWHGEVARALATGPKNSTQGFLLLLANAVTSRALLFGHGAPFPVREGMKAGIGRERPHLALVACALEPTGQALASHGFTQTVLNARCFMPVNSTFERDLFILLLELQVALDAHGIDCAITRPFDEISCAFTDSLQLHFGFEGSTRHELTIRMTAAPSVTQPTETDVFLLSPIQLSDNAFVEWLEVQIKSRFHAS